MRTLDSNGVLAASRTPNCYQRSIARWSTAAGPRVALGVTGRKTDKPPTRCWTLSVSLSSLQPVLQEKGAHSDRRTRLRHREYRR